MDDSKKLRLCQAIFLLIPISSASEADDVYEFAGALAVQTVEAIEAVGLEHDIQPEAVGRYVVERCNRFMSEAAIAAVITEAIAEETGLGSIAQVHFDVALTALDIEEVTVPVVIPGGRMAPSSAKDATKPPKAASSAKDATEPPKAASSAKDNITAPKSRKGR